MSAGRIGLAVGLYARHRGHPKEGLASPEEWRGDEKEEWRGFGEAERWGTRISV